MATAACKLMVTLNDHETELFDACQFGDLESVIDMIIERGVDPKKRHPENGETPLHWASRYGQLSVVKHLVEVELCDVNSASHDGSTPLYLACRQNHVAVVEYLLKNPDVYPSQRDPAGETPLHWACKKGKLPIIKGLIEVRLVNPNCKDNSGQTPLHFACRWGHQDVVEYLVKNPNVDSNVTDDSGLTPLYKACSCGHKEIAERLLKGPHIDANCSESNGWTPLHWACDWGFLGIVKTLIKDHRADPNFKDNKGWTPFHWACRSRYGRNALLTYLVEHASANLDCVTADGQTAFDIIQSSKGVRLLLTLGATPTYDLDEQYFPSYLRQDTADMSIKMFVLGNSGSGKSTLTKSLKKERTGFARFKSRFIKVKSVGDQTAGVIPYDIIRKAMGSITLFDFAGDKMFYAGHDAILSNSMANSSSIILLMLDLTYDEKLFRESLVFWLEFIRSRCSEIGARPHVLLVGSHADQSGDVVAKSEVMKSFANSSKFDGLTFAGQIALDCRFAESPSMTELISMLSRSCQMLRSSQTMSFQSHCFLQFLLKKFSDTAAVTLGTAEVELAEATKEEIYLTFLENHNLFEICQHLNERGNILFMSNPSNRLNSWIILNKAVLLSHVFGAVFAPQGFREHQGIANSSGVVPMSKLVHLFPRFDSDMIIGFLCHMRFCQEVLNHQFLACLKIEADNISSSESERFFLFPGLIQLGTPSHLWELGSDCEYSFGWLLRCISPEQFFTPRFIQVLLLQLFTLATSSHDPVLQSKCRIWNNGISWTNKNGVENIIEVTDRKMVVVLSRCKLSERLEMARLRSSIIENILEVRNEISPKLSVNESLIRPEDVIHYPLQVDLSNIKTISVADVAEAIVEGGLTISFKSGDELELEKILLFEPYAYLGKQTLCELFAENENQEITEQCLHLIAARQPQQVDCFKAMMITPTSQQCAVENGPIVDNELMKVLLTWKGKLSSDKHTLRDLRNEWDHYSVFAGRNVFELCN